MTDEVAPQLRLVQVFLKAATFSHRGEPIMLAPNTAQPAQSCGVAFTIFDLQPKNIEATSDASIPGSAPVLITVEVSTSPETAPDALYDFSVEMAAIIEKDDDAARALDQDRLLEIGGALLYPYVREAVSNLTIRGRFGPVWLNPYNVRGAVKSMREAEEKRVTATGTSG